MFASSSFLARIAKQELLKRLPFSRKEICFTLATKDVFLFDHFVVDLLFTSKWPFVHKEVSFLHNRSVVFAMVKGPLRMRAGQGPRPEEERAASPVFAFPLLVLTFLHFVVHFQQGN